jgi:hypothetical protein
MVGKKCQELPTTLAVEVDRSGLSAPMQRPVGSVYINGTKKRKVGIKSQVPL